LTTSRCARAAEGRGFTLVEMLISLALIGLMVVLLFSGLRLGSRSWDSVERHAGHNSEIRQVMGFVQRSLENMHPLLQDTGEGAKLLFAGEEDALEFVTPFSAYLGLGGLYLVRLEQREGELVLTYWLHHPEVLEGETDLPEWVSLRDGRSRIDAGSEDEQELRQVFGQKVLLEGLEKFEVEYFGTPFGAAEAEWQTEWKEETQMPLAVRVRFELEDLNEWWPAIYVGLSQVSGG